MVPANLQMQLTQCRECGCHTGASVGFGQVHEQHFRKLCLTSGVETFRRLDDALDSGIRCGIGSAQCQQSPCVTGGPNFKCGQAHRGRGEFLSVGIDFVFEVPQLLFSIRQVCGVCFEPFAGRFVLFTHGLEAS